MNNLEVIINQMIVFVVLLIIGFIAAKAKVLTNIVLDSLAKVMINITIPAMLLTLIPASATRENLLQTIPFLFASIILLFFLYFIGWLSAKIGRLNGNTVGVHIAETTWGNAGFIGIPLLLAFLGNKGMLYISIYTIPEFALLWTLGSYLTSVEKGTNIKNNLKKMINPTTVSIVVSIIFVIIGFNPKGIAVDTVRYLGDTTKYLSILYIGGTLAYVNFWLTCKKGSIYLIVIMKMIIAPLIVFFVLSAAGSIFTREAIMTLTIITALPAMTTVAMMARTSGSDGEYASEVVFLTTILSIFTIPFVMYLISLIA